MPIATIGTYRLNESTSEAMTSSIHTAPNHPSLLLIISIASPYTLQPEMDSDDRLCAMEEEVAANQMKTDTIELALKAIIKLEVPALEESVMEEVFIFGQNSRVPVNSKM